MTRREAREQAFMLVFEWEFQRIPLEEIIGNAQIGREAEIDGYAKKLSEAVLEHIDEIDAKIDVFSTKWKKKRIAKVSLAVLRVALGEMLYMSRIPASVSINEAVDITKKYATQPDASYVNGVLGAAFRAFAPEEEKEQG